VRASAHAGAAHLGLALTHHPHVHGIVPGGGLAPDGKSWIACRPGFFLSVRVLSRLFRRRFVEELQRVHQAGKLQFFGEHVALADAATFKAWLAPLRECEWVVYAKRPFAGPQAVLAYLSRYTHRVAISNSRLIATDDRSVTFRWKDFYGDLFVKLFLVPWLDVQVDRCFMNAMRSEDPRVGITSVRADARTNFYPCKGVDTLHRMLHARKAHWQTPITEAPYPGPSGFDEEVWAARDYWFNKLKRMK
jgi:hypothetical protein